MDNKHQENGALRGPLIFTLPAFNFVVILSFDWFDEANWAAVSVKTHGWNYPATRPRTAKEFASGVLNQGRPGHGFRRLLRQLPAFVQQLGRTRAPASKPLHLGPQSRSGTGVTTTM
jgi:hypothetical protein